MFLSSNGDVLTVYLYRTHQENDAIQESRDQELREESKDRKSISFDCVSTNFSLNWSKILPGIAK